MPHFGGILHPSSFQMNELIASMQTAYPATPSLFFRHHNLELVAFSSSVIEKENIAILFDGNIENTKEIEQLLGMTFPTHHDLIFHAYRAWGELFMKKIQGSFAIVVYDKTTMMLYLIRDRIGSKSLYWAETGNYFLFATELKGLLATGVLPQTPSPNGFSSYLYFGYIPQDLSAVSCVNKLLPGYFLKTDLKARYSIEQYWSLSEEIKEKKIVPPQNKNGYSTVELDEEPEECLEDLVQMVWQLDEPVADLSCVAVWKGKLTLEKLAQAKEETFEKKANYSLAYKLARLPSFLRDRFVLPLSNLIAPDFKWRVLRNIEVNRDLMAYLSSVALFGCHERKWVSPFLHSHFDPEIFIERFHRLSVIGKGQDMIFYFNAKTRVPDQILFEFEKLQEQPGMLPLDKITPLRVNEAVINKWCRSHYMRELFTLLPEGALVEQGIVSPQWIRHQLGYPHLVPKVFKKLWAILILEIWFRLYIKMPIGKSSLTATPDQLLRS